LVTGGADANDAYVSLSHDTSNNKLFAVWIDTSNSNIFYSFCSTSTGCDSDTEWVGDTGQETTWVSTGINTNVTMNYSSSTAIFGEWTVGSASPYTVSSGVTVPEFTWLFFGIAPLVPLLGKLRRKNKL